MELLNSDVQLRSKRELIEKFIKENLPKIEDADNIQEEFEQWHTLTNPPASLQINPAVY
jgi:type I restriction enzyme R subunit